jgi:hypothetical protein
MQQIKHYILETALVVALILAIGALVKYRNSNQNLTDALSIAQDSTHHYRNKYGEIVAQTRVMQLDKLQLEGNLKTLGLKNAQLTGQVTKLGNLALVYYSRASVKQGITVGLRDSIVYKEKEKLVYKDFDFKTKYLNLKGFVIHDTLNAKYTYSSPLLITVSKKSDGLFKGFHLEAKASFEDPAARIDNQTVVWLIPTKKPWYQTTLFKVSVGIVGGIVLDNKLNHH